VTARAWIVSALAMRALVARADEPVASGERRPEPSEPIAPPIERAPTAADTALAPPPGGESGRSDEIDPGDSTARVFARDLLFVPKVIVQGVLLPVRGGVWVYDRYHLRDWYYRLFYSGDLTIGVLPIASYQTGLGATIGARLVDFDVFGEHEHLTAEASYGGSYRASALVGLDSGRRFRALTLGAGATFIRRPSDPFYGIGNNDVGPQPAMPIDARSDATAYATYYRYQELRASVAADERVTHDLHVALLGAFTDLTYGTSTKATPITEIYDEMGLVGFTSGVRHLYGELELRWDTRRRASVWEPIDLHATGSLARTFVGRLHRVDGGADFWHYGGELQHYIRFAPGPRVLVLRFYGEGVTGGRDEVPFTELPMLGGDLLRGYVFGRFRDRIAAFATAEYIWDISHFFDAYVFTDAGRVFPGLDELSLAHLRVGFGIGVEFHADRFLFEASIATSIDGGVVGTVAFNPILDEKPTWR
jgi:hypothetical protein